MTDGEAGGASDLVYSRTELADQLGCWVGTIDRLTAEGRIPHVRLSSRKPVYPKRQIEEWLADEAHASTILAELEDDGVHHGIRREGVA